MKLSKRTLDSIALHFSGIVICDGEGSYIMADALNPSDGDSQGGFCLMRSLMRLNDGDTYFSLREESSDSEINMDSETFVEEKRYQEELAEQIRENQKALVRKEAERLKQSLSPAALEQLKNLI